MLTFESQRQVAIGDVQCPHRLPAPDLPVHPWAAAAVLRPRSLSRRMIPLCSRFGVRFHLLHLHQEEGAARTLRIKEIIY